MPIKQSVFCLAACAGLAEYFHTICTYENPLSPCEFKSFEFRLHFLEVVSNIVKIVLFCGIFKIHMAYCSYFFEYSFFNSVYLLSTTLGHI